MSDCADADGNCTVSRDFDGLPAQCVRPWATDKHDLLRRFVEATAQARASYDGTRPTKGDFPPGGTGYIELFGGPGRARVRDTGQFIDGSPLVALRAAAKNPFTDVVLCDLAHANAEALRQRTHAYGARVVEGDCNKCIDQIVSSIPEHGYNFALVDPYAASVLKFATIERLARIRRMDLVIHFPTGSMKRNWQCDYEELLGLPTSKWNVELVRPSDITKLIPVLRRQLIALGYSNEEIHTNTPAIKNSSNTVLYHLVFASKHSLGKKIWNSITDTRHNQRALDLR